MNMQKVLQLLFRDFKHCSHVHHGDCGLLYLSQNHFSNSYLNISNGALASWVLYNIQLKKEG